MAQVEFQFTQNCLICFLAGEIDHHTAQQLREQTDARILSLTPERVILDFSKITFMDSSGIGLILGRNTMMRVLGGKLSIQNPPEQICRILELAKIESFFTAQEASSEK